MQDKIDKILIKCSEAEHSKRGLEIVSKKFLEEKAHYDAQLLVLERTLRQRSKDLEDLMLMAKSA